MVRDYTFMFDRETQHSRVVTETWLYKILWWRKWSEKFVHVADSVG